MFYIVGLGNPGKKYLHTRHNVGWTILDYICAQQGLAKPAPQQHLEGSTTQGAISNIPVSVLYPDTFMNNSGNAVAKFVPRSEIGNLIVIHDDIDLPCGEIKLGKGRGDGGNNGIKSIIETLGTKDFIRIRIGIAPRHFWTKEVVRPKGGGPLERFVLKPFTRSEEEQIKKVQDSAYSALQEVIQNGIESAMNKYN